MNLLQKHYTLKQHSVKKMIELENYHFVTILEMLDSGQNHQWMSKTIEFNFNGIFT